MVTWRTLILHKELFSKRQYSKIIFYDKIDSKGGDQNAKIEIWGQYISLLTQKFIRIKVLQLCKNLYYAFQYRKGLDLNILNIMEYNLVIMLELVLTQKIKEPLLDMALENHIHNGWSEICMKILLLIFIPFLNLLLLLLLLRQKGLVLEFPIDIMKKLRQSEPRTIREVIVHPLYQSYVKICIYVQPRPLHLQTLMTTIIIEIENDYISTL